MFFATAVVVLVAMGINSQKVELMDLDMENVEALASSESSGGGTLYGNSSGTKFCCSSGSNSCGAASC